MKMLCLRLTLILPLAAAACVGTSGTSSPLSPAIAGPIPGVGISAPTVVAPPVDALVNTNSQPITLQVGNAETTGVRPLSYRFEIATDPNFTNAVFIKDAVTQGSGGRTSMTLPGPLSPERKYYWHVRAEDGANTGPFGATSAFNVFTPIAFGTPTLVAPVGNVTTSNQQPTFVIANAPHTGPVTQAVYYLEIASSADFSQVVASYSFPETSGQSQLTAPAALAAGQYFWHARAFEGTNSGPFSSVQSFRTPSIGGGGGGGVGGGGVFNPNGNWQACGSTPGAEIVSCVYSAITPAATVDSIFEMTKRVAWLLRGSGFGLLKKGGGDNVSFWNGTGYAAARIVTTDGHLYKLLSDVPNGGPQWADEGVDTGLIPLWTAPIQP
jgi:hypothetical protein